MTGDPEVGVNLVDAQKCGNLAEFTAGCSAGTRESVPNPGEPRLSISGEAGLGFVYDGNSVRPHSSVAIMISFDASTDGGMTIHGSAKLPSAQ